MWLMLLLQWNITSWKKGGKYERLPILNTTTADAQGGQRFNASQGPAAFAQASRGKKLQRRGGLTHSENGALGATQMQSTGHS